MKVWTYSIRIDQGGSGETQGEFRARDADHACRIVRLVMDRWVGLRDLVGAFGSGPAYLRVEAFFRRGMDIYVTAKNYWVGARHEELMRGAGAPPGCRHDWGPAPPVMEKLGRLRVFTSRCAACGLVRREYLRDTDEYGRTAETVSYEMPQAPSDRTGMVTRG